MVVRRPSSRFLSVGTNPENLFPPPLSSGDQQAISVGGEVLGDLKRATKVDGRNQAVRLEIGVDEFGRSQASSCLVGEIHVRVVKKQH